MKSRYGTARVVYGFGTDVWFSTSLIIWISQLYIGYDMTVYDGV